MVEYLPVGPKEAPQTIIGKKMIDFSPPLNPYFTVRLTSESFNGPLKVLPEGSMVEYLPVGSQEAPQTIIAKKNFKP